MGQWKKVSIWTMIVAFLVVIAGCSSSNTNTESTANEKASSKNMGTPSETNNPTPQGGGVKEGAIDLKGRTIKIATFWDIEPKGDTENSEKELKRWRDVEAKYNVKLKVVNIPYEEFRDQFTASALAGKPIGDMAYLEMSWITTAAQGGLLQNLNDYVNRDYWPKNMMDWAGYKGDLYGMSPSSVSGRGIYYNKTLFKNAGLEDPYDLVMKKEWTWDKFLEMAKQLTKDTDGDGKIDQYGYHGVWYMIGQDFINSNNAEVIGFKDGKYISGWDEPNAREALRFIYDLIHVHKVVAPFPAEERTDAFTSGKVAMKQTMGWEGTQIKTVLGDNFGFIPTPMGPKADKYYSPHGGPASVVIPKGVENPEVLVKIFEELTGPAEDWDNSTRETLEGSQPSERDVDLILSLKNDVKMARETISQSTNANFVEAMADIFYEGVTAEVAVEKRKLAMQNAIDEFFNK